MMSDEPETTECVVCGEYLGATGPREGRGKKGERCLECTESGKVPEGYELRHGSMVPKESDTDEASEEQAVSTAEATDAGSIRERLPEDVRDSLTKKAFSPGSVRKVLRDTYYMGPIGIGSGGWIGVYGGGQPGTEMRRPGGALYNFPRSWRYAALERGLNLGLIIHVGAGRFAATERGVAVLNRIDTCPDCGVDRQPHLRSSYYVGNPNTDGHVESHELVTACPECGTDGYGGAGSSVQVGFSAWERDEDAVEWASEFISDHPDARVYGVDRPVDESAADRSPDVDPDATEDLLEARVENQANPSRREVFGAVREGLYGRPVVPVPSDGEFYRFRGTEAAIAASRTDEQGDIHVTVEADTLACSADECNFRMGEDGGSDGMDCPKCQDGDLELGAHPENPRLKVGMSYEVAVEYNVKDAVGYHEGAEWTGNYWTIEAENLGRAVSKLSNAYTEDERQGWAWSPHSDVEVPDGARWFTVSVTEDAMEAVDAPMVGVTEDGDLIERED